MIEIKDVNKSFGFTHVLKDVSAQIHPYEITCVIGPSGTGKSTLLRCILNLETIDSGEIIVDGLNSADRLKHLGVVFQDLHLFKHMTVLQNITYALKKVNNLDEFSTNEKAENLLTQFNLVDQKDKYPSKLSGGQRQRVAIIRSLALNPNYLLLDEPTSALDADTVLDFVHLLKEIRTSTGIMIITHDLNFAKRVADQIILMDNGHIVEHTTSKNFFENPQTEIAKRYIESQIL